MTSPPAPPLVVAIGAPRGTSDALADLLAALPAEGWAVVIVGPAVEEAIEPITSRSPLSVVPPSDDARPLAPDHLYLAPSGAIEARREDGRLALAPHDGGPAPIDGFFCSLSRTGPQIGVRLTDAVDDGAAGLDAIRAAGGLALTHEGDVTATLDAITRFARSRDEGAAAGDEASPPSGDDEPSAAVQQQIAEVLNTSRGFDPSVYKPTTMRRRIARRMALAGHATGEAYLAHLRESAPEQQRLVDDLLIGVTDFFRDPEALAKLDEVALRPLVARAESGTTLRIWVAGCATGEEAYTLAILVNEAIRAEGRALGLELFATDLDEEAIAFARRAVYPEVVARRIASSLVERYFEKTPAGAYRVRPDLRAQISFALHDVVRTAPFSRMHLVSCRNLLIYLGPEAQAHVLRMLHFALRPEGHLFLGTSESTGPAERLFEPLSKRWRIYRRREVDHTPRPSPSSLPPRPRPVLHPNSRRPVAVSELARRAVLRSRVPATIVVSAPGDILFMHGELRPYLRFPDGDPALDLNAIVTPELRTRVRAALFKCRRDEATVVVEARSGDGGETRVTATPAPEVGDGAVVVSFETVEGMPTAARLEPPHTRAEESLVDQLERELRATQDDLRHTVEELETSNEALIAANEEASSMNEELQSANEELEATTEELRSVNEELHNVNAELREKIDQVERGHDDLANFFASTHIATVFCDDELAIKRFTPAAAELLRLSARDVGHHIGEVSRELLEVGLVEDARWVLDHLTPRSTEIRTAAGRWMIRRVLPYRTEDRRVEGVVMTLVDVTDLKHATERLAAREQQQAVIARLGLEALEEPDLEQFMGRAVREIQQVLGTDYCKLLELQPDGDHLLLRAGVGWREGLVGQMTVPAALESHAGFTLKGQAPVFVADFADEKRFSTSQLLRDHGVTSGLSCVVRGGRTPYGVLGVHTRARRHFTDEDANFLVAMATVIAAAVGRDQTTTRLSIEGAVAQVLSRATSRSDVFAGIYEAFANHLGAVVGELWLPFDDTLQAVEIFTSAGIDEDRVREHFTNRHFRPGEGSVGRAFKHAAAEWVTAAQATPGFARSAEAAALGLSSGLAVPLLAAGEVTAIFTVFSPGTIFADEPLLRSLAGMGRAIGETLRRLETQARARQIEARAAEALRRGEERYRNLFEGAGVSLWEKDFSAVVGLIDKLRAEGVDDLRRHLADHPELVERALDLVGIRDVNERTVELLGASAKRDLLGSLRTTFMPETVSLFVEELIALAEGRTLVTGTTVRRTLRGDPLDVAVTVRFPPAPGPYDRVPVSLTDITPIKRAQARAEDSQRWFNRLAEATPDLVAVYDVDHDGIVWTNRDRDLTRAQLLADDEARPFYRMVAEGTATEADERVVVVDDGSRWLQIRAVPFGLTETASGRLVLVVARDVTDLKQTERRLLEANRQKDDFLAMLGHELRNPLAAVRNAAELLRLTKGDARVDRVQAVLDRQTRHMAKLIDGLLDVSRIIRGKIEIARENVDLRAVVSDLVDDYRDRFRQRDVALVVENEGEPLKVVGDRVRLAQVADNLLSNALKFTGAGGTVTFRLDREGEHARLAVEDTGAGIEPELIDRVFQSFWQAEQTIDRTTGGLGLGLAVVKGLVELHDGAVSATSEGRGRGTTFTVRLPLREVTEGAAAPPPAEVLPLRVLVVEDHADASFLFAQILEHDGHEVHLAHNGRDAISAVPAFRPHVVLCDIGLPEMSGLEVARALRRDDPSLLLVAVSGYGRREDVSRSIAAGFDMHLSKPVSVASIRRILAEATRREMPPDAHR